MTRRHTLPNGVPIQLADVSAVFPDETLVLVGLPGHFATLLTNSFDAAKALASELSLLVTAAKEATL